MTSLAELAREVGISPSTASRALNRPNLVRSEVVVRVREAAQRLGYAPNPFARSLRVRDSKTLGLIVPDSTNPFFAEVARGIEAACFRAGYTLILCNSDRSLEKEAAQARVLFEKRVDGVLLFNVSDRSAAAMEWLQERGVSVVLVERRSPGPAVDSVASDNRAGVRLALEHLAGLGHQQVACLSGEPDVTHYRDRVQTFRETVAELGLSDDAALVRTGLITFAEGQGAAMELLQLDPPPTALFCATDTLAIGAVRGVALAGRRVPEDVSVVGYGNTEITAYTQPPLTSVEQDKLNVGSKAVRALLSRIARKSDGRPEPTPRAHVVPTRLVVRESSGPARGAR